MASQIYFSSPSNNSRVSNWRLSNWTVCARLLSCDYQVACKYKLLITKDQQSFFSCLVWKFIRFGKRHFERSFSWCHVSLRNLLKMLDEYAISSYCRMDVSWNQPVKKSVGKWLLALNQESVFKCKQYFYRAIILFLKSS